MQRQRFIVALSVMLLFAPTWATAQTLGLAIPPGLPLYRIYEVVPPSLEAAISHESEVRPVSNSSPLIAIPEKYPEPACPTAPPDSFLRDTKLDATWLPNLGRHGLGMNDLEFATTIEWDWLLAPIRITPYAAARFWMAPEADARIVHLYDLNVELAWRPRLAEWFFLDLAVTPGLYTDFKHVAADSFMMRGRVVPIVAFSEKLQLAAGAMYVNRNRTKVLPAGGVIWTPSGDTRYFLFFPQPKISHRLLTVGQTQLWGYLAGEFGGGRWEVEVAPGTNESLDYTDWRVLLGMEAVQAERLRGHIELGYVFNRRINLASFPNDAYPASTLMLRAGVRY
jgi:hypothetical protein